MPVRRHSHPIHEVKQLIFEKIGVPPGHYHLEFNGMPLDFRVTLLDCNVKSNSVLSMRLQDPRWLLPDPTSGLAMGRSQLQPAAAAQSRPW